MTENTTGTEQGITTGIGRHSSLAWLLQAVSGEFA